MGFATHVPSTQSPSAHWVLRAAQSDAAVHVSGTVVTVVPPAPPVPPPPALVVGVLPPPPVVSTLCAQPRSKASRHPAHHAARASAVSLEVIGRFPFVVKEASGDRRAAGAVPAPHRSIRVCPGARARCNAR